MGWNPAHLKVDVLFCSSQLIHLAATLDRGSSFFCSFVYGFNDKNGRLAMFQQLADLLCAGPWIVLGDFNCLANLNERQDNLSSYMRFNLFDIVCLCVVCMIRIVMVVSLLGIINRLAPNGCSVRLIELCVIPCGRMLILMLRCISI